MSEKSPVDNLFDMADDVLGKLDRGLPPARGKGKEPKWTETHWCPVTDPDGGASVWHAFQESTTTSICGETFTSSQMEGRRVLDYGKQIVACTSCIIGVSK